MPDPSTFDKEDDWMAECVPARVKEGDEQDQAVAACMGMWADKSAGGEVDKAGTVRNAARRALKELLALLEDRTIPEALRQELTEARDSLKRTWADLEGEAMEISDQAIPAKSAGTLASSGAVELPMLLTKTQTMADGRVRWQARANTGEWDLEHERFDVTFWDDVLHNFSKVQEATTKGEITNLPVPILDIAHYSFRLPAAKRNLARAGYPIKLWQDGKALMAQGYFDETPLGKAAAKAAQSRPVEDRRVSIGVWPDWGRVELTEDGRRIYKGGRDRAYLDHLAMTGSPVDPGTILEVKSMGQKQDALDVLGEDATALVDELEEATIGKAMPAAAIVKAECECDQKPEQKAEGEGDAEAEPAPDSGSKTITVEQLREMFAGILDSFNKSLNDRLAPIEAGVAQVAEIKAQVQALGATETEKVKAAVDSPKGDWLTEIIKKSVQRREPVKGAEPETAVDTSDPFYEVFGGLKKQ